MVRVAFFERVTSAGMVRWYPAGGRRSGVDWMESHRGDDHGELVAGNRNAGIAGSLPAMRGLTRRWLLAGADGERETSAELLSRVLRARGLFDQEAIRRFLAPTLKEDLHGHWLLPGVPEAADRLVEFVRAGRKIAIYGDYDVDGITATAILFHAIRQVQADHPVRPYVPHRLEEGYGLNCDALTRLHEEGCELVISVDCGITAVAPAAHARSIGLELIITDHHELPDDGVLPDALLVHPRLPGSAYPFPDLCGAGVAFKLAVQFLQRYYGFAYASQGVLPKNLREFMANLLPLVALGTIADVAPLQDENRVLVREGLRRIPSYPMPGLHALIAASKFASDGTSRVPVIDCERVGFHLAPRLNACGRMGHAEKAVELLTTATAERAREIATFLDARNKERQTEGQRIFEQACAKVESQQMTEPDRRIIVLADDHWHPGIVGIICSRLVERYGRPAILLCGDDQAILRGSGRSIPGFSLHAALGACAAHLERYGGHEMAAGLALKRSAFDAFHEAIRAYALQHISPEDLIPSISIDCDAMLSELDLKVVRSLRDMGPFGRGNRRPVVRFRGVVVDGIRLIGSGSRHLELRVRAEGRNQIMRAIWWGQGAFESELTRGMRLDLVAEPKLDTFGRRESVQLEIRDLCPAEG